MSHPLSAHLRRNAIAYLALFLFALTGSAHAFGRGEANSQQIGSKAVKDKLVANDAVGGPKAASGAVTTPKLGDGSMTAAFVSQTLAAGARRPDLIVKRLSAVPPTLEQGQRFRAKVKVRNRGKRKARKSITRFYLGKKGRRSGSDVRLRGRLKTRALKPRRSVKGKSRVRVPRRTEPGRYYLLACADDTKMVNESNEKNNCRASKRPTKVGRPSPDPTPPAPPDPDPPPPDGSSPPGTDPTLPPTDPEPEPRPQPPPPDPPPPGPPPPSGQAPSLSDNSATSLLDATSFLYTGDGAAQRGVADGTIELRRVAVLRGNVIDALGQPLSGVRVSVLDRPELGSTSTRADGGFDMAINGGGTVILEFERQGYLPVQRRLETPWQDYVVVDEVTMTELDPETTEVEQDANAIQIAQGSEGHRGEGPHMATVMFEPGTRGSMRMPNGSQRALGTMTVRATEYTANGLEAMPGELPPTTGYTYAVEFSVDEAIAAGADKVEFDKPVINYTENIIGAPVGSPVPTAWYDRDEAQWVPARNGRVIEIVGRSGGRAQVDADGDGNADSDDALNELGLDVAERTSLASLYQDGQELWRVEIDHFTPWDHNWPYGPPPCNPVGNTNVRPACTPPLKEFVWKDPNDPCNRPGQSTIGCETQTLGEELDITGAPFSLNYSSSRVPGWKVNDTIEIPITDGAPPDRLKGIELTIDIAGRRFEQRWCHDLPDAWWSHICGELELPQVEEDMTYEFRWDGLDAYGRPVHGSPRATIGLTYVWDFQRYEASDDFQQSFGQLPSTSEVFSGANNCANRQGPLFSGGGGGGGATSAMPAPSIPPEQRAELEAAQKRRHFLCGILVRETIKRPVGALDAKGLGLGGWTLDAHHSYDPDAKVLYSGDGSSTRADSLGRVVETVAGRGARVPNIHSFDFMRNLTVAPDGTTYIVDGFIERIRRLDPDGKMTYAAGTGERGDPQCDGRPALEATLGQNLFGIEAAPDGSVYFTTTFQSLRDVGMICRITPDGRLVRVAGRASEHGPCQEAGQPSLCPDDTGPASEARVFQPLGVHLAPDGSIYYGERASAGNLAKHRVRRIDAAGRVATVVGGGSNSALDADLGDGVPALEAQINVPYGLAATPDGTLYISDPTRHRIQALGTDGRLRRFAGDHANPSSCADAFELGVDRREARIGDPVGLALGIDGTLYVRSRCFRDRILEIDSEGTVAQVSGSRTSGCTEDEGALALSICAFWTHNEAIDVAPDGSLIVGEDRNRARAIRPALPSFSGSQLVVPSPDGSEVYEFTGSGRHLRTLDALTGAVRYRFAYDGQGRLDSISDGDGNETAVERSSNGTPVAIVAPGGQRTSLAVNGAGWLASVANPAGETASFTYTSADGLLASMTRPGGGTSRYAYDSEGRLIRDTAPSGHAVRLTRSETERAKSVTLETALGRTSTYTIELLPGGERRRTIREPSGAETVARAVDGQRIVTRPDGTRVSVTMGADPRWGALVATPDETVVESPGGHRQRVTFDYTMALADPRNPFSIEFFSVTSTLRRGSQSHSSMLDYNGSTRRFTTTSPEGRETTTTVDARGRIVRHTLGSGVSALTVQYDSRGRPSGIAQGTESQTYEYDSQNRQVALVDGSGARTEYSYDSADRITEARLPGGRSYRYQYDPDGNLTALVMPNGARHTLAYDSSGQRTGYTPPGGGAFVERYNADQGRDRLTLPTGGAVTFGYDSAGRDSGTGAPDDRRSFSYAGVTSQLAGMTRNPTNGGSAQSVSFERDGQLPTATTFSGAAAGTFAYSFDADAIPTQMQLVSGGEETTAALQYDRDLLATRVGPFTITRNGPDGAPSRIADGQARLDLTYDGQARTRTRTLTVGGQQRYGFDLTRNSAGRITQKIERTGSTERTYAYAYDAAGRLTEVRRDGTTIERYAYDANGNRTSRQLGSGAAEAATFDPRDRIQRQGGVAYGFDADGFMTERGGDRFRYGRLGELIEARVGGRTITYSYDAAGRLTARYSPEGTRQFLYGNPENFLQVTAVRSENGTLSVLHYDSDDMLHAIERGDDLFYVGADQVGTPRVVSDSAGTVVKELDYDAFGNRTADSAPGFDLPIGFAGGLHDPETGLVAFGMRHYDTRSGGWTARDPSLFAGSPLNLYAYAEGDPVGRRDPTGLWSAGFSAYNAYGGGIQFSYKDGKMGFCSEIGVGKGGGAEVDFVAEVPETGGTIVGEVSGGWGPVAGGVGAELDLDCLNVKGTTKLSVGPLALGGDTDRGLSVTAGGGEKGDFDPRQFIRKVGTKGEGKISWKQCASW